MLLILFLLSCLVLTLEVLETKIFSYSLPNNFIFLVVGVVLLGFGTGGTVLSLRKEIGDPKPLVRRNLLLTSVLLVLAHVWFAHFSHRLTFKFDFFTLSILVLLSSPYFTAGMAISAILADPRGNLHARYGINLLGSALGCLVVFFLLGPLTGPQCLILCALLCAALALPLVRRRLRLLLLIAAVGTPLFLYADQVLPYQIQGTESAGQLALIQQTAKKIAAENDAVQRVDLVEKFDRWDPTARVQVHALDVETSHAGYQASLEQLPSMWFTQDSSYGSPLIGRGLNPEGVRGVYERSCYGIGYFRKRTGPEVLVIGLGGAPDVQTALHHGAKSIDGVDINRSAVQMVRSHPELRDFLGDPYGDPRFTCHIQDGRSFVRGSKRKYDLIQLSGVDTKSILASGTLALNESYLYTQEAFDDYLKCLKPDGILCIIYAGDQLRHRLAVTAMTSLKERFQSLEPHRHLLMAEQSSIFCLLVKKTPFGLEECQQMQAWLQDCDRGEGQTGVVVMVYELLTQGLSLANAPKAIYLPDGGPIKDPLMQAAQQGEMQAWLDAQRQDLSPAPDWRPFFFHTTRNAEVWQAETRPPHFQQMLDLLQIMMALALVLIAGPLIVFQRRGLRMLAQAPYALYFAALGCGYILAMSGLIQQYVLFLGHQAYAFPVVIGGLLVAAGGGSFLAGKMQAKPGRVIFMAVAGICTMLLLIQVGLAWLLGLTADLGLGLRVPISLLVLLPLGIPLGMMFPTGLALVKRGSPLFVPWAFGINGVFSVIGTMLVLPGAILFGFPSMAAAAGGIYLLAALVGIPLARRSGGGQAGAL